MTNSTRAQGTLEARAPFDLRRSLAFIAGFPPCSGERCVTDTSLTEAFTLNGTTMAVRITAAADSVAYQAISNEQIATVTHEALRRRVSDQFGLQDDLSEFYRLASRDQHFAPIVQHLRGLHHVRFPSVIEAAVWFILSQRSPKQVSLPTKRRIAERFGHSITVGDQTHLAFPELADLRGVSADDWHSVVKNERKSAYLTNVVAGLDDLGEDWLANAPYDDAFGALKQIKGVGEFTAAAILLRGLGRMNHVPLEMPSFDQPARELYGQAYDPVWLRAHYGNQLGYWSYYLKTSGGISALRAA